MTPNNKQALVRLLVAVSIAFLIFALIVLIFAAGHLSPVGHLLLYIPSLAALSVLITFFINKKRKSNDK